MARAPGVLQIGAEGGVGQPGAAVELVVLQLGEHAKALGVAPAPVRQAVAQGFADAHAQRTADAADFQRVGQARVDMVVAGNRVNPLPQRPRRAYELSSLRHSAAHRAG